MKSLFSRLFVAACVVTTLCACDGIYDDPSELTVQDESGQSFHYIDATDYRRWVYIRLAEKDTIGVAIDDTASVPSQWDLALHRYDVKTHDGAALETEYVSLEAFRADVQSGAFPLPSPDDMVRDEADSVIVDMSTMMDGYITCVASFLNREMGKWLDVDLSSMPPTYTPSNRVYLLWLHDGTYAAIRFTDFANPNRYNTKGYISFDYCYPLKSE